MAMTSSASCTCSCSIGAGLRSSSVTLAAIPTHKYASAVHSNNSGADAPSIRVPSSDTAKRYSAPAATTRYRFSRRSGRRGASYGTVGVIAVNVQYSAFADPETQ